MADSAISVTAGSGTSVDTRTESTNGQHRQVIVIGDPAANTGVAPVDATNGLSVTLTTALPAGTAAIGKLAANSGVDIGDVTIDNATLAVTQSGTWDEVGINDSGNSITVDGTVAVNVISGFATAAAQTDKSQFAKITDGTDTLLISAGGAALVDGSATTQPVSGTFYQATQPVSLTSTTVTGTVAVTQSGTWDEIGINDSGNSITVDGTVTANAGSGTFITTSVGTIADDATTPGAPVMVGGMAVSPDGTDPGSVAEADVARFKTDLNRRLLVNNVHPQMWSYHEDSSSALTDASVAADPGDGFSIFVTDIVVSTGAATAMNVFFEEGSTKVLGPYYLEAVAGRGLALHFTTPKKITASTALTVTSSAAIAHSIDCFGFVAAV